MSESGVLVLAATPIGDVADASPRLVRRAGRRRRDRGRGHPAVAAAAATGSDVDTTARIVSYFEGNEVGADRGTGAAS